jgi:DNA-binding MarR family transcriptional regulator
VSPRRSGATIAQLLDKGWIVESEQCLNPALDDQRRRYYRLTPTGRQVAAAEVDRLGHWYAPPTRGASC